MIFPSLPITCESPGAVVSHHIDAWTFCFKSLSFCLSVFSVFVSVSVSRDLVFLCFVGFRTAHLSFVCLSNGGCTSQPKPRPAGRRIRVGLPTSAKSQKMDRETLPKCSLPSNSCHPRAFSHCLNNRISKLALRRSQLLQWISHRMDWFSTSLLGPTWSRLQRMPWVSTSQQGTMRHHSPGEDLNSDAIVNAQLTHLISRDDAAQGQDAHDVPDVLMPDAQAVHDIATPRRIIGGRCRKWCISAQPPAGKRKSAACSMCGIRFTHGEARLQQWRNRLTNNHYVHAHCVNGGLGHDHELHPNKKQLMQLPVNGIPLPEQQRTQKFYSLLLRIWIKPQQLLHPMMSGICLDAKRLFAWMKKSWTSSGLNTLHGTASKICEARRMSNLPRGSGLRWSNPNMPFSEPSFTTIPPLWRQSQLGKRWCSAAGSFWDDLQSTPLRAPTGCAIRAFLGSGLVCSLGHGTC